MSEKECSHGKSYDEPCAHCEIIWQEESIAWLTVSLNKAHEALKRAKREMAQGAAQAPNDEEG